MMQTATHCRGVDVALDYSTAIRQRHDAVSPATQTQVAAAAAAAAGGAGVDEILTLVFAPAPRQLDRRPSRLAAALFTNSWLRRCSPRVLDLVLQK